MNTVEGAKMSVSECSVIFQIDSVVHNSKSFLFITESWYSCQTSSFNIWW